MSQFENWVFGRMVRTRRALAKPRDGGGGAPAQGRGDNAQASPGDSIAVARGSEASTVTRDDRGAVTVEAAIALCSLLVVFGLALAGVSAVTGQLRCTDAAGSAARLIARGQWQQAEAVVDAVAPAGTRLIVRAERDAVSVIVVADALGGLLPGVELRGEAYAVLEPDVGQPPAGVGSGDGDV